MSERRVEHVKIYHRYSKDSHEANVEVVYDDGLEDHVDWLDEGRIIYSPELLIGKTPKEVAAFYKNINKIRRSYD